MRSSLTCLFRSRRPDGWVTCTTAPPGPGTPLGRRGTDNHPRPRSVRPAGPVRFLCRHPPDQRGRGAMSDGTPQYNQQNPNPYAAGGQPYGAPMQPSSDRFNVMAIVGFVLAFVVNIAGLVVSIIALSQIKKTGERGRGLALAGIIISALSLVFGIIWVIFVIAVVANAPAGSMGSY
ncbi:DUF4190 domain-containing protein [Curtobacterium flaccumfaciens]|nr:DUF4190 domain-containing protein [Curtobacterium flaccumfaciens]